MLNYLMIGPLLTNMIQSDSMARKVHFYEY